jgi:hypothetical protein
VSRNPEAKQLAVESKMLRKTAQMGIGKQVRFAAWGVAIVANLSGTLCYSGRVENDTRLDFKNTTPLRNPSAKLVFMLTTGFDDLVEVKLCLEDVKAVKTSGHVEDVILLVRGRGVQVLGKPGGVLIRPPEIVKLVREVKAAGVPIIASADSMREQQISFADLDPKPTHLVDDSAAFMADLVSKSYEVIRY